MRINERINEILVEEIGDAGARGGSLGGTLGGGIGGGVAGAIGGAAGSAQGGAEGAKFAAKRLPTVDFQDSVVYEGSLEEAKKAVSNAIVGAAGYRRMVNIDSDSTNPSFFAVIGSGWGYMNPAVMCITMELAGENSTNIHIRSSERRTHKAKNSKKGSFTDS